MRARAQLWPTSEALQQVLADVPLGRLGRPEEVAHAAAYLLGPYAAYITGACLDLDGGQGLNKGHFLMPPV